MNEERFTKGFTILSVFYAFSLIVSNVLAGKVVLIFGFEVTAAIAVFPVVYILSDVLTEVYGIKLSMFSIRINFICCALFVLFTQAMVIAPYPDYWQNQSAYKIVFDSVPRIFIASLFSYYFGNWVNSSLLSWLKRTQKRKGFAFRAIASSVVAHAVDSMCFFTVAYLGVLPLSSLIAIALGEYVLKLSYEIVFLPITVKVVAWWKKLDSTDVTDTGSLAMYNPFSR